MKLVLDKEKEEKNKKIFTNLGIEIKHQDFFTRKGKKYGSRNTFDKL